MGFLSRVWRSTKKALSKTWSWIKKPLELLGDVLGEVVGWLMPDVPDAPDLDSENKGILANKDSTLSQIPVVYGQRKVGGTRVLVSSSGTDNEYLYIVLVLCEGEIQSIDSVYLDDVISTDSRWGSTVTINQYLGTDGQSADSMFTSAGISWTSDHKLSGVAYLAVRLKWDSDVYSSIPTIHAIVKGRKVYDARTSTTAYSSNPALCLRDYLTNTRYGKGLATSSINDTLFNSAANKCDEDVVPYSGASAQNIFECHAVLNTDKRLIDNVQVLLSGMRGLMPYSQGVYGLIVEDEGSSVYTFTEDHIIDGIQIDGVNKKNRYNRVIAKYVNPSNNYQTDQIEYPPSGSSEYTTYLTEDGDTPLEKNINLATINNIYTAEDIAEIVLKQSRNGLFCSFKATSEALQVSIGDIVGVTHTTPSWSAKPFRVMRMMLNVDGTVNLELIEHQDSIYPWSTKTEADDIPDTTLPDPFSVIAPTSLATVESLYDTIGSAGVKVRVAISWTASTDKFVEKYTVEWKKSADSDWIFLTTTSNTTARLDDVDPTLYDFRVRAVNSMGVSSAYTTLSNVTVNGLTTPPVDVTGLSLIALSGNAHITWDLATDLDVRVGGKVRFRHSNKTSGATWESSTDIGSAVAGHNTTAVLPLLAGTYMAKFVDSTGNESVTVTSFTATTVPNISTMNLVDTSTQHPSFTGTKTDMISADGILKFESDVLFDSFTGLMDTWYLLDAYGGLDKVGTYEFDTYIDLGRIYTSRVTSDVTFTAFTLGDFIDDRTTLMDTWSDFDNIPSDVNLDLYVATTNDDPTGTPTWHDWAKFTVSDHLTRAYKFKVIATSTDVLHQINITALSVTVDMPERTERQAGLQSGTSKLSVTYPSPFYALPSLGVTVVDLDSNDLLEVTNESTTGFDIGVTHGASYEDHKFNYQARGY